MLHHIQKLAQTDQRLYVRAKTFTTKHESLWSWIRQSHLRCDMKNIATKDKYQQFLMQYEPAIPL